MWSKQQAPGSLVARLIKEEERDDLFTVLGLMARLHEQPAVVKCKADNLLHVADDLAVANPAMGQGQASQL